MNTESTTWSSTRNRDLDDEISVVVLAVVASDGFYTRSTELIGSITAFDAPATSALFGAQSAAFKKAVAAAAELSSTAAPFAAALDHYRAALPRHSSWSLWEKNHGHSVVSPTGYGASKLRNYSRSLLFDPMYARPALMQHGTAAQPPGQVPPLPDQALRWLFELLSEKFTAAELAEAIAGLPTQKRLEIVEQIVGMMAHGDRGADRAHTRADQRQSVIDRLETVKSGVAGAILAPHAKETRSAVQKRRQSGELIGLPIGTRPDYVYPLFQFDRSRHSVKDLVAYANKMLDAANDPFGAASWWLTPSSTVLDGHTPLEELDAMTLTEMAVDNLLETRGM
ncbi:hypothetical protein ERC79_10750 [Rhodococcus sp. ABRD24]|uniref:hypothetical protein n=1 Tax=Rhodococcus sp. ABRD24 TaxID=2507582 RepID=UPI00103A1171|nr:hypothetical protein [Rhodococcus sp. ABRD24]QBJ96392.1 hypothetical protein ERC79_10750 [Rhodococcus sp. ABRD24]